MSMKRYLRQRRRGWYVAVTVPEKIRHLIGAKEIVRSLKTRSLEEANRRKWKAVADIKEELEKVASGGHLDARAFEVAKDYKSYQETMEEDPEEPWTSDPYPGLDDLVEDIEKGQGKEAASRFYMIATGQGLPVTAAAEMWLQEQGGLKEQTKVHRKADLKEFAVWAKDPFVHIVTRTMAGQYVSKFLLGQHKFSRQADGTLAPTTVERKLGALSGLWKWMGRRGLLKDYRENPWEGQADAAPRSRKRATTTTKRPLTGNEVKAWLEVAKREETQSDLITLGLWTGARLDELCSLETADVTTEGDVAWLSIRIGKTAAATRAIPVVDPEAVNALQRRMATGSTRMFPELSPAGPDGKLSWNVQKRLGTSRQKALE